MTSRTATEECLFLIVREAQQLVLKQSVRDQEFEGQQEKDRKQGGFAKINEAACIIDDNPHAALAALSSRLLLWVKEFVAIQLLC